MSTTASGSATVEICRAAHKRGYIVTNVAGRRKWQWAATLQAPINGIAQTWRLTADSKSSLLTQIAAMPEQERWW